MSNRMAIILAGGKGTRMKSDLCKVLHPICGLPMVTHVLRAVQTCQVSEIVSIIGHGAEAVKTELGDQTFYAMQSQQLGTGHAVLQAAPLLSQKDGNTLVICGDTPLLSAETLQQLFQHHETTGAKATILTALVPDATDYGRIIRSGTGQVEKIVEQRDANVDELEVNEINTGTYIFDNRLLFDMLAKVTNHNAQGEYYLTDVIGLLSEAHELVSAYRLADYEEAMGINDRVALATATQCMQKRINVNHMRQGVSMMNPAATYIDADVEIGADTVIEAGVYLQGQTKIGQHCFIGMHSQIRDSIIADRVRITQSVIEQSTIDTDTDVGPYAHLRPHSHLGQRVHIGNFVEVKNATLGAGTKSGHLTYIGDADLGRDINVGCGTIFVNYDGKHKHRSTVADQAFIGCNANIVSPVHIAERVFIAAGTTVTEDVAAESLAISRTKQENKANYWQKFLEK